MVLGVVKSCNFSNSSKLLCMSLLPASMNRIRSRTAEKKPQQHFSHYKSMRIFSDTQGQQNRIQSRTAEKKWRHCFSNHKPMGIFFRRSGAANSAVSGPIRPKFKLVRALIHVIVTCKYGKERMKNSREKVETPFFPS